jgi:hypothetical protein
MAAAVVMVLGAALGAYSQVSAGNSANDIARRNAGLANQTAADNEKIAIENVAIANAEANAIEQKGLDTIALKRKEISRLLAYQRTQEAVSGFRYEGTPLDVAEESAREGEQDVAMIWANALTEAEQTRAKGRVLALQGESIAGQLRTQGDIMIQQGSYAQSAGYLGATSTLLQGVSNAYTYSQYPSLTTQRMKIG